MYLYLFTSTVWKFICTVCSTEKFVSKLNSSFCSCVTQQQQHGKYFGFAFGAIGGAGQDYG